MPQDCRYCAKALDVFGTDMSVEEKLRWYWVADIVAGHVWDDDRWQLLTDRHVQLARDVGALSELPMALSARAFILCSLVSWPKQRP